MDVLLGALWTYLRASESGEGDIRSHSSSPMAQKNKRCDVPRPPTTLPFCVHTLPHTLI